LFLTLNFISGRRMLKYIGSRLLEKVLCFSQNENKWKGGDKFELFAFGNNVIANPNYSLTITYLDYKNKEPEYLTDYI
jgi:hypothetical protein